MNSNTSAITPEDILRGYLPCNVAVPNYTPASDQPLLTEIGRGTYGIIFERSETVEVVKRPINPHAPPPENKYHLRNDYLMHKLIYESMQTVSYDNVHIPRPLRFISADDREWWSVWRSRFDRQYREASDLLFTERIPSVPRPVRHALADCFSPEPYRSVTKASPKNNICLIHPLIGRRKGSYTLRAMLNLRNYKLCVDQMENLGFNIDNLIDTMAESLAILHFLAHVDAHDIEFVYGAAPTMMHYDLVSSEESTIMHKTDGSKGVKRTNFHGRAAHLWMLDFNRVSRIPDIKDYVPMALRGFIDQSEAYYPRPRFPLDDSNDNKNWTRFKSTYMLSSSTLRGSTDTNLQAQFLEAIENHYQTEQLRRVEKE